MQGVSDCKAPTPCGNRIGTQVGTLHDIKRL
ncbi:hypothetical protein [His2 virus]|uniref:Uncharacterized protein n=1 Tax=His 2 virus TaxID=128710 RepID=Q25BF4_HIS2V|nr:hypothetical protein His2V_gp06 [His2 virus]AAQ13772.1 hypothetical protein [His2 virus]